MTGAIGDKLNSMPADILVVTPSPALGESIRRALEETSLYRVHVVNNKASAIVRADELGVPLAMLDLALGESWTLEVGSSLRTIHRGINLIILCDEGAAAPAFNELRPWILVRKPFRMSDFMTAISQPQSAANAPSASRAKEDSTPLWLRDQTRAAQKLTTLTLSSAAQAALITRKNDLWAYAGALSQEAANELARAVTRNWDGQKGSDLLRFIRLESTKAEHMLFATRLADDVALALIFESETPFSAIRSQAGQLISDLNQFDAPKAPPEPAPETESAPEENIPSITSILTDVPDPNPPQRKKFDPNETRVSESLSEVTAFSRESSPSARLPKREPIKAPFVQPQASLNEVEVTAPSRPRTPVAPPVEKGAEMEVTRENPSKEKRPATPVAPPVSSSEVTRESPVTQAAKKLVVEPVSAGMYHLTYACLLVPRFASHYLTGDLSERLSEWAHNICIAFGWRLEYLSVRPEYLQWVVNVPPNTSPGYLMRVFRQQTSEKIFNEFPRFKRDNPSSDFWAPGYLIMGGTQPHPQHLVNDYIRQTRQRQGQESSRS